MCQDRHILFFCSHSITVHCSLFTIHYLVLSQVATASVVTARVASVVTATIRGSAVVVDVVVLRPRIRCSLGCSNLSLGLVGPCQLHILLQLVTSGL